MGSCLVTHPHAKKANLFPRAVLSLTFSTNEIAHENYKSPNSNPLPNKPWFLHVCCTGLSKTLWEKEKLLVTSKCSFPHSVFYPF